MWLVSFALASDVGVRAHLRLDGDLTDSVGAFDGTANGGSGYGQGVCGLASNLTNDRWVSLPDALATGLTAWSVSVWFRPAFGQPWDRVWDFGSHQDIDGGFFLSTHNVRTSAITATAHADMNTPFDASCAVSAQDAFWYHGVFTWEDGVGGHFWLDGVDCGTIPAGTVPSLASFTPAELNLKVGASNWPAEDPTFVGRIDELRIYDRALSPTEAVVLHSVPCGPFTDSDGDQVPDSIDACVGDDATGDGDSDGYCADLDCDDAQASAYPGATVIPGDGLDNDCSGDADECWIDADLDGYGGVGPASSSSAGCAGAGEASIGGDCQDDDPAVHTGAHEVCDGADQDCDGEVDEDYDGDGDGVSVCAGDCDDSNPLVAPGNIDSCL
ncbi:MAG: hypothetical protein KC656_18540, partial [Myxococcales bacterium]|nr:hypothetical protein [Myxococcales bacterium]